MKHHIKQDPTIVLELTKEELEHLFSATLFEHSAHKKLHVEHVHREYNEGLSEGIAIKLEEIYNSIK